MISRSSIICIGVGASLLLGLIILALWPIPKPNYEIQKVISIHS